MLKLNLLQTQESNLSVSVALSNSLFCILPFLPNCHFTKKASTIAAKKRLLFLLLWTASHPVFLGPSWLRPSLCVVASFSGMLTPDWSSSLSLELPALSVTTHFQHSLISLAWLEPDSSLVASLYLSVFISSSCWRPFLLSLAPLWQGNTVTSDILKHFFLHALLVLFLFFFWKEDIKTYLIFVIESDPYISSSRHIY